MVKYLKDGREVTLVSETSDGLVVRERVEYLYGDEVTYGDGALLLVEQVYDKPPMPVYNDELRRLSDERAAARDKLNELEREVGQLNNKIAEQNKILQGNKWIESVQDFLDSKITHFVLEEDQWKIVEHDDEQLNDGHGYNKKKRLISLRGDLKKTLKWEINSYSDGSGSWRGIYPFKSRQDALDFIQSELSQCEEYGWRARSLIGACRRYGLKVPEVMAKADQESKKAVIERAISDYEIKLKAERAKLRDLRKAQ